MAKTGVKIKPRKAQIFTGKVHFVYRTSTYPIGWALACNNTPYPDAAPVGKAVKVNFVDDSTEVTCGNCHRIEWAATRS